MKKLTLLAAVFLFLSLQAQNTGKKEKIKALFVVMHQDSLMIKTVDAMSAALATNMSAIFKDSIYTHLNIDMEAITKKLVERNLQRSKDNSLKLLHGEMVDIYEKHFTEGDIDDLTIFYQSKTGQKMLDKMPHITKDIMTVMAQKYQPDMLKSYQEDFEEVMKEIREKVKQKEIK